MIWARDKDGRLYRFSGQHLYYLELAWEFDTAWVIGRLDGSGRQEIALLTQGQARYVQDHLDEWLMEEKL